MSGRAREIWGGSHTRLMGVLNVTPDSFSDGGQFIDPTRAIAQGLDMARAGAAIIDIGGESSRPGATPVSDAAEVERVLPVIRGLRAQSDVAISIDTVKTTVARAALAAGADIINDINGLRAPGMVELAVETGAPVVAMHMRGTPETMQTGDLSSADIVDEVCAWLFARAEALKAAGVRREAICLDPGIGFGKTVEQNLLLLARTAEVAALGYPVLVGVSRKSVLGAVTGAPIAERAFASAAASAIAALLGATVLRVHDVAEMAQVAQVVDAIRGAV